MRPVAQVHPELRIWELDDSCERDKRRIGKHVEADVLAVALAVDATSFYDVVAECAAIRSSSEIFSNSIIVAFV